VYEFFAERLIAFLLEASAGGQECVKVSRSLAHKEHIGGAN